MELEGESTARQACVQLNFLLSDVPFYRESVVYIAQNEIFTLFTLSPAWFTDWRARNFSKVDADIP